MAYTINSNDRQIVIEDGTINTETPLSLIGRDYFGYGTEIAQNFVDLMQNFAGSTAPSDPITGTAWYDTAQRSLKLWTGSEWKGTSFTEYTVYDNTQDPNDANPHNVFVIKSNSVVVCVMSSDEAFTLNGNAVFDGTMTKELYDIWGSTEIKRGININPTDDGLEAFKLHGTATTAEYADVAELYSSDQEYAPGTVVKLGGSAEVTQTTKALCDNVFGVVSTDPAYLMNSMMEGTTVAVALAGRIPCRVIGEVRKGQRIVASETPGVARVATENEHSEGLDWFRVIGRALEDKTTLAEGTVEIVVGTK